MALVSAPILAFYFSLFFGRYPIDPANVLRILATDLKLPVNQSSVPHVESVIVNLVRLPRVILALTVGAGLAISGASYQGMTQNPLVSCDILGVASAASFGGILGLYFSESWWMVELFAFGFGLIAMVFAFSIARIYKTTPILMLVLSGVIVASFFSAMIEILQYIANPFQLQTMVFYLLGSFASTTWGTLFPAVPIIIIGIIGLTLVRWRINILAMGDKEARSLGLRTERLKVFIIVCGALITASAVVVSGVIGWVGLMIPHVGRMIVGPDHKVLIPASIAIGGTYLLIMDDVARTLITSEIPIGILTSLIGAPFFIMILRRTKGGWK